MSYDPRSIAFAAEILHPPQPLRADLAQTVHNALYRQQGLGYQNFQVAQDGIHLTNLAQAPGQVSAVSFAWDRIVLREELRSTTVEDFAARVVNVTKIAFQTLGLSTTVAQQFVVRSLVAPRNFRDGRDFLGQRLIASGPDAWQKFGRPLQSLGVRYVFPPHERDQQTCQVRIESWPQDARSIWIETTGSHAAPLTTDTLPRIADRMTATYRFLTGPVCDYIAELDKP